VIFRPLRIAGAYAIEPEPHLDERGSFGRAWCSREFEAHGLPSLMYQCSISTNRRRGTLRGMHYSVPPHAEAKLIRCINGSVYDVLLDLRPESATYRHWIAEALSRDNGVALFLPEGIAHGFQTLEDNTDVLYLMNEFYHPDCSRAVRWNDPAFGIQWPLGDAIISDSDRNCPSFSR